jgi:S-DNA-T family DNA segregation ATPase FtsK/SpoIIIE
MAKTKRDKAKDAPADVQETPSGRFIRYCVAVGLLGLIVFIWMSLLTYSPQDWPPGSYEYPQQGFENAAGRIGAFLSHTILHWLGNGVFLAMVFLTIAAGMLLFNGKLTDLPWRLAGLVLLTAGASTALHLHNPTSPDGTLAPAGVLGAGSGKFLQTNLASQGAWLVTLVVLAMGLMLCADFLVFGVPKWIIAGVKSLKQHREARLEARAALEAELNKQAASRPGPAPTPRPAPVAAETVIASVPVEAKPDRKAKSGPQPVVPPAAAKPVARAATSKSGKPDELPSTSLLAEPVGGYAESQQEAARMKGATLQQTLDNFGVDAQVVGHTTGPVITLFELALAPGVKVSQVAGLDTDIARSLAVPGVRVVPHLPGRDTIGIEVPNMDKEMVCIKALMDLKPHAGDSMPLPLYLGKDAGGGPIVVDLASMPHMLIAGTTGSGKSVCINTIIMSLLMTRRADEIGFILVDPKMVEMAAFEDIQHLLCPIINDMRRAEGILEWATEKMDERYDLLREAGVRNIAGFNALDPEEIYRRMGAETDEAKAKVPTRLKYFVVIIDELADLMMTSSKEVENHIIRIAQKARAVGIHLILATQRPSANVVTGLIKSNMPCRISFRVASKQESRIVLDQNGAEVLLGKGDMLVLLPGESNLLRAQGTFIDDPEIKAVTNEVRKAGKPEYNRELIQLQSGEEAGGDGISGEKDELFDKAVEFVLQAQRGSVSLLQRKMSIGYGRASRIIDQMAEAGILGDHKGSQARECMMTIEDWHHLQSSIAADQSGASSADGSGTSY